MEKNNQPKENKMQSIRINDDLVLLIHPEPGIVETSASWTNFNESDPGVTLVEVFAFLTESLLGQARPGTDQSRLNKLSLLKLHKKSKALEELLARLLAEQSE
jgi:hypothetical protein